MGIENPVHLLFLAVVALVVLGPRRLPELARALGKGVREFRDALEQGSARSPHETAHAEPAPPPVPQAAPPPPAAPDPEEQLAATVDPARSLPSGDAPDHRPL
jgi:sec-independent protein translocase protein TatB